MSAEYPFVDPMSGVTVTLVVDDNPGVIHPNCATRADVSPDLDAFYCPQCRWNGRISCAWFMELLNDAAVAAIKGENP